MREEIGLTWVPFHTALRAKYKIKDIPDNSIFIEYDINKLNYFLTTIPLRYNPYISWDKIEEQASSLVRQGYKIADLGIECLPDGDKQFGKMVVTPPEPLLKYKWKGLKQTIKNWWSDKISSDKPRAYFSEDRE